MEWRHFADKLIVEKISRPQDLGLCYPTQPLASADNITLGLDNSCYHAELHPLVVNIFIVI